jgi:hypothetical protein
VPLEVEAISEAVAIAIKEEDGAGGVLLALGVRLGQLEAVGGLLVLGTDEFEQVGTALGDVFERGQVAVVWGQVVIRLGERSVCLLSVQGRRGRSA